MSSAQTNFLKAMKADVEATFSRDNAWARRDMLAALENDPYEDDDGIFPVREAAGFMDEWRGWRICRFRNLWVQIIFIKITAQPTHPDGLGF